jgi:hypothetical protein
MRINTATRRSHYSVARHAIAGRPNRGWLRSVISTRVPIYRVPLQAKSGWERLRLYRNTGFARVFAGTTDANGLLHSIDHNRRYDGCRGQTTGTSEYT